MFKLQIATTSQLKAEVYKIRYRVYCQDLRLKDPDEFPDQMEMDQYDQHSTHLILKYQEQYIGCVRIIHSQPNNLLPFEKLCHSDNISNLKENGSIAEISRLAVTDKFRNGNSSKYENFPLAPLNLYLGVLVVAHTTGLEKLCTIMESRLHRQLQYIGFCFHQIGNTVFYANKQRAPFYIRTEEAFQNLKSEYKPLLEKIQLEICT